ncbi:hypothetical protein [Haloquadratum walsbyi]|uniref:Phage integrase family n=1 Tax=Haloquadratum walsbyi J07HQW2 TaxID=1238425 RepID=U1PJY0_9EURY|nr:hypothetical protein [Haloquadratum walsbyi]ERG93972.1 MAG: hypothetical protein J07HQW2_00406 [Haloquadratum walsbyi J07HQW2]
MCDYHIKAKKLNKSNPFTDVDVSHLDSENASTEKVTLKQSEVGALVEPMTEMRTKALLSFISTTGARTGEAIRFTKRKYRSV